MKVLGLFRFIRYLVLIVWIDPEHYSSGEKKRKTQDIWIYWFVSLFFLCSNRRYVVSKYILLFSFPIVYYRIFWIIVILAMCIVSCFWNWQGLVSCSFIFYFMKQKKTKKHKIEPMAYNWSVDDNHCELDLDSYHHLLQFSNKNVWLAHFAKWGITLNYT